jgi:hypothetical protein
LLLLTALLLLFILVLVVLVLLLLLLVAARVGTTRLSLLETNNLDIVVALVVVLS